MDGLLHIRYLWTWFFWLVVSSLAYGQRGLPIGPLDSLQHLIKQSKSDTNHVKQFLTLAQLYIARTGDLASDSDTALSLCRQAYALSHALSYGKGQAKSYITGAQAYRRKGDVQKGRYCAQRAVDLMTRYGSFMDQADAYTELAAFYTVSEKGLKQSVQLNERIVSLFQRAGSTLKLANELVHRGDLYQLQSNNVQSLKALRQALASYQSIGYKYLQQVYDRLGFVSSKTGDYEAGIRYGLLAMKTAETVGDSLLLGEIYNRLGTTYKELNQPEKSLFYFEKTLKVSRKQNHKSTIVLLGITISDMVDVYSRTGKVPGADETISLKKALDHLEDVVRSRPADKADLDCQLAVASCFVNYYGRLQHKYARAQTYCDQLEDLLSTDLGEDYQLYIHSILIPFYVGSHQYRKGYSLLARNEKLCQKTAYLKQLSINHLWWFELDSVQANYPSAIAHYQRHRLLTDSLLNKTQNQKIAQLEVQYRTQEKEHNIQELTQQSKLQKIDLQKAQTTRNFTIFGAIMLVLLLGLGYNRYQLKQHSNQLLQAQQAEIQEKNHTLNGLLSEKDDLISEKEWLLKEIHHRVKNNLQLTISLLQTQGKYLSDQTAISAIEQSQHRVRAMALIHQKLYRTESTSHVDMPTYIREVVEQLAESFDPDERINFRFHLTPLELDISQAIPLGLIINEAITNALKYAFPTGYRPKDLWGTIDLSLAKVDSENYLLVVEDDGVGLPQDVDLRQHVSMGANIMRRLSKQLGGTLQVESTKGVRISVSFTLIKLQAHHDHVS